MKGRITIEGNGLKIEQIKSQSSRMMLHLIHPYQKSITLIITFIDYGEDCNTQMHNLICMDV